MMIRSLLALLALSMLAFTGCSDDVTAPHPQSSTDDGIRTRPLEFEGLTLPSASKSHKKISKGILYTFADFGTEAGRRGKVKIKRETGEIDLKVKSSQLDPGSVVTTWAVIWNNPSACAGPECLDSDFANPATMVDVVYGGGAVVKPNGKVEIEGELNEGDASGSIFTGLGLMDAQVAEIHIIVRGHGPAIPELLAEQLGSFNGGCNPGEPNEGLCEDLQAALTPRP